MEAFVNNPEQCMRHEVFLPYVAGDRSSKLMAEAKAVVDGQEEREGLMRTY